MKKTLILTAVTTLLASIALPAVAQDAGAAVKVETPAVNAQGGANAGGANANASANAGANVGGMSDNTFGSVMSSLSSSGDVDLSAINDEAKVSVVLLSSLQGNAATEAAALDEALTANAEKMTTLHSNIDANAAIKAKLEAEGHTTDDVVAVKSNADGSLIVYVDDRA